MLLLGKMRVNKAMFKLFFLDGEMAVVSLDALIQL